MLGVDPRARRRFRRPLLPVSRSESWSLEEGIVKAGSFSIDQGVGVRAVSGEKTGVRLFRRHLAASLLDAARDGDARHRPRRGRSRVRRRARSRGARARSIRRIDPVATLDRRGKGRAARARSSACARARDPRVAQVMAALAGEYESVLVARSDGTLAADVRPLVRLSITVIVEQNGRREQGMRRRRRALRLRATSPTTCSTSYATQAVDAGARSISTRAPRRPATMTVVLGPGWPGILLHEAIGHGLEGDFNRKGTSAFSGRIGQRVAAPGVTVVDDGTLADRRGSLNVDDEGNPTQRTVLIEDGVLRGYMQDALNARLMGVAPTGNGRRESFAHMPMPRMTNTLHAGRRQATRRRSSRR